MSISITMVNLKTEINNLTRNCLVTNVCSVPRPQRNPWYAQDLPKKKWIEHKISQNIWLKLWITLFSLQAKFARWEPAHGRFNFKHPWQQYLKIGASMRSCACCVEALKRCIDSENQVTIFPHSSLILMKPIFFFPDRFPPVLQCLKTGLWIHKEASEQYLPESELQLFQCYERGSKNYQDNEKITLHRFLSWRNEEYSARSAKWTKFSS